MKIRKNNSEPKGPESRREPKPNMNKNNVETYDSNVSESSTNEKLGNSNIFVIGDSHCIYYKDSDSIKTHWVGWGQMPVTIYQLIQNGLSLYNIVEKLPPGDICTTNIKEDDYVVFMYGWNDVQKNIHKYSTTPGSQGYQEMIDSLISGYINLIKRYSNGELYKIKPIISCVYPIPLSINDSITGSETDRIKYTLYMSEKLKMACLENNIPFFDIYDLISENNKLNINIADKDLTHLDRTNSQLRCVIEERLFSLISPGSAETYNIYFHNWWNGFFTRQDGNHIGFFEKLLSFTIMKKFKITDINKANVLIEAGKPNDNIRDSKKWIKINFIGEPVFSDYEKYDLVLTGSVSKPNIVDLPVSVMYILGNNFIPRLSSPPIKTSIPPYFCCFIVSNPKCKERNKMFEMLNKYKKVNSAGSYANNTHHINYPWWSEQFIEYISMHKFMICFENTKMETYSTEKIVNTFLARTIPIYWATDHVHNIFNPESMIFLKDETEESFQNVVNRVIELDNNDEKYLEFVNKPIFNEQNQRYWEENYSFASLGKKINRLIVPEPKVLEVLVPEPWVLEVLVPESKPEKEITLFITSCGRLNLLRTTLTSFFKFNTYPIKQVILCEDSGVKGCVDFVTEILPTYLQSRVIFCYNEERIGQMKTIEKYIKLVDTDFIFHLEDDFEFFDYGFIELSLKILDSDPKISQVLLEDEQYTFYKQDIGNPLCVKILTNHPSLISANNGDGALNVFSWRPSLKRKEIALLRIPYQSWDDEYTIQLEVNKKGMYAVVPLAGRQGKGFCTHIGKNYHVNIPPNKSILTRRDFPDKINIRLKDI